MNFLAEYGISKRHILDAIYAFKQGEKVEPKNCSSTTYVLDETDQTLWDLKPIVVRASEISRASNPLLPRLVPSAFTTHDPRPAILELGFQVAVFDSRSSTRRLGLRGFDPSALQDSHVLFLPDGTESTNALASNAAGWEGAENPIQKTSLLKRYVRNSDFVIRILKEANGLCFCCKGNSFETPSGNRFLEVHHKHWLRDRGPDTLENMVALCPNCHRREHHGLVTERKYW